jgi:hypothetical protein
MKKYYIYFLTFIFLISCEGSYKNDPKLVERISKKGFSYYQGLSEESSTWLNFGKNKVEYHIKTFGHSWTVIDDKKIVGTYKIKPNNGKYLIELDFETKSIGVDFYGGLNSNDLNNGKVTLDSGSREIILPNIINGELDGKNGFNLEGWELIEQEGYTPTFDDN